MALRRMRKLSPEGDTLIAEYDTDVTSPECLKEIEAEFNNLTKTQGFWAADITNQVDEIIHEFRPESDILLSPRVQGGSR